VFEARVSPLRFLESGSADGQNKVSNYRRHRRGDEAAADAFGAAISAPVMIGILIADRDAVDYERGPAAG
jgi:hypothetical protein